MKTRWEINFEEHSVWRIRHSGTAETVSCPLCRHASEMIPAEKLALFLDISPRDIYRRIELGDLHFGETENRQIFVCLASFTNGGGFSARS